MVESMSDKSRVLALQHPVIGGYLVQVQVNNNVSYVNPVPRPIQRPGRASDVVGFSFAVVLSAEC